MFQMQQPKNITCMSCYEHYLSGHTLYRGTSNSAANYFERDVHSSVNMSSHKLNSLSTNCLNFLQYILTVVEIHAANRFS